MRNARTRITHGSPRLFWSTVRPLRPPPLTAAYVLHSETLAVYSAADFLTCRSDVILFVNDVHFRIKFISIRGFDIVGINSWKNSYRMLFPRNRHTSLTCLFGRFFRTKKPFNLSRYEFFAIDWLFYFFLFSFLFYESFFWKILRKRGFNKLLYKGK